MPHFDIVKKSEVQNSFRVARIMSDFDIKTEHANEHFVGDITYPDNWKIGAIVGGSGTGKSTIAKQLYKDDIVIDYEYKASSVIDDMPNASVDEIERAFYAVGFGSVPSWLKPYSVLSEGEKMRVNLARTLLDENKLIVFDEFTSVVDRNVAKTCCMAINKAIHRSDKQFIAVSCHKDILEYLQPDWVFDTDTMQCFFTIAHDRKSNMQSKYVGENNGKNLGVIII